jgi:hypothetical protein
MSHEARLRWQYNQGENSLQCGAFGYDDLYEEVRYGGGFLQSGHRFVKLTMKTFCLRKSKL